MPRSANLAIRVLSGTAWAAVLVIAGLWLVFDLSRLHAPAFRWPVVLGGAAALAGGQFILMVVVADRLYPNVARRLGVWMVEMSVFTVFMLGAILGLVITYWGALP